MVKDGTPLMPRLPPHKHIRRVGVHSFLMVTPNGRGRGACPRCSPTHGAPPVLRIPSRPHHGRSKLVPAMVRGLGGSSRGETLRRPRPPSRWERPGYAATWGPWQRRALGAGPRAGPRRPWLVNYKCHCSELLGCKLFPVYTSPCNAAQGTPYPINKLNPSPLSLSSNPPLLHFYPVILNTPFSHLSCRPSASSITFHSLRASLVGRLIMTLGVAE